MQVIFILLIAALAIGGLIGLILAYPFIFVSLIALSLPLAVLYDLSKNGKRTRIL